MDYESMCRGFKSLRARHLLGFLVNEMVNTFQLTV